MIISIIYVALSTLALLGSGWAVRDVYLDREYVNNHRPNPSMKIITDLMLWASIGILGLILSVDTLAVCSFFWSVLLYVAPLVILGGFVGLLILLYIYRKQLLKNRKSASVGYRER